MLLRLLEKKEKRNRQTPRQGGLDGDRRDKGRKTGKSMVIFIWLALV